MKQIFIAREPMDLESWSYHEAEDFLEFLKGEFDTWPDNARIYHNQVASCNDVTPHCDEDIERLNSLDGRFYVVLYPGDIITIVLVAIAVVAVASVFLLRPPIPTLRNTQNQSPNNELAERRNRPRINARIPDIFGTVNATPDLISVPHKVFIDHQEVEYAYMCVGRGEYAIAEADVYDDTTRITDIAGASVEIYGPDTSPNSGSPQLTIGSSITEPLLNTKRSNSVNGQVLRAPNSSNVNGASNIYFEYPNTINLIGGTGIDFTDFFAASDSLSVTGATDTRTIAAVDDTISIRCTDAGTIEFETADTDAYFPSGSLTLSGATFSYTIGVGSIDLDGTYTISSKTGTVLTLDDPVSVNSDWNNITGNFTGDKTDYETCDLDVASINEPVNLNGSYTVLSVSPSTITLSSPASVNSDWNILSYFSGDKTGNISPILNTSGSKWIGPFTLDVTDLTKVYSNFVALNGLYKDDGEQQIAFNVTVEIEATPVDSSGTPTGSAETFQGTVQGSATLKDTRALTLKATPTFTGRCEVRARRVTNADTAFEGNVVDEVKWRDLYAVSPVTDSHFGNVTTVHSLTYATAGALALKERKLNMKVTRKIPTRVSGLTFTSELTATNKADEIFSFICLDQYIGNRSTSEIDFDSIYDEIAKVRSYFGNDVAGEFSYTFDADNLSFEETAQMIASAVFCTAYRRGNIIKLTFEKETEESSLLFNHRNKLPGSETRTVRFGNEKNHDGVTYKYVSPDDDAIISYFIPSDQSAINPREIESNGVRSGLQAHFHAWRAWQKIQYQNTISEFTATQEADLLVQNERVLVADNTRTGTQDGDVLSQSGLELTLSQDVDLTVYSSYNAFLQLYDGTVESIGVTAGSAANKVILASAPSLPLVVDDDSSVRTLYQIVGDTEARGNAFLIAEKTTQSNFTSTVKAVNYDARYYAKDKDYIDGAVDEDGNEV